MAEAYTGQLMPPPVWYPTYLPLFYNTGRGFYLHPLNAVPNYTDADILDLLLYYASIVGYNRSDTVRNGQLAGVAGNPAWTSPGGWSSVVWARAAFKRDANGDGSGNWADIPTDGRGVDGALWSKLQQRYIDRNKANMPWLSAMQAKGGGIDLMTIPMPTDVEIPRPSWYPAYLPSLYISGSLPGQWPAGKLDTKPKLVNFSGNSGYKPYAITARDVAALMMYAQPVVLTGPSPYPLLWYVNDDVNGAMAMWYKITLASQGPHSNAQMQTWGVAGNLMVLPTLDANPFASGFTTALQGIVSAAIKFFAGEIPGGSALVSAANKVALMGGAGIAGGPLQTSSSYTASVFAAADQLTKDMKKAGDTKILLMVAAALGVLGWWAHEEGYIKL